MPLTLSEARSEMFGLVQAVTDTFTDFEVFWQDRAGQPVQGDDVAPHSWARVIVQSEGRGQSTLSGGTGERRFTTDGTLIMQLFTPTSDGLVVADELAEALRNSVEGRGSGNGVWFRNARTIEIGQDGAWHQTNVLADFQYDEVR